jgi:putative transcriptional regulator
MSIVINLDVQIAKHKMKLTELSHLVGISVQNLSVLKTGKARAIRFSTLDKLCQALECTPGDLIEYRESP